MTEEAKTKILLIEDEQDILELYTLQFQNEGFLIVSADRGEAGLKLAREEKPDIILLDIILPKMDGFKILKKLKSNSATRDIPVIMLTNLGGQRDVEEGQRLGAKDYLVKANYTPEQVVEKVREFLKK